MIRQCTLSLVVLAFTAVVKADEHFVTIQGVTGNRIQVVQNSGPVRGMGQGMGRGRRGGGIEGQPAQGIGRGRGRFGGRALPQTPKTVVVPALAKITIAMRERRTFEFRVMGEIAGGLRNPIFTDMKQPMEARIVATNGIISEINVITGDTDINQTSTTSSGESVLAVKPKRPPMKRK